MSEPKLDQAAIGPELKALLNYVQDCDRRVNRGEIMDLSGLDRKVIILCDAIAHMPQSDAVGFEPQMNELIKGLETLATSMKEQQAKMTAGSAG